MLIHSIGRGTGPSYTDPWIRKHIFPGGYIPALSEVIPKVERSGLFVTDIEILRFHYSKTLHSWSSRFYSNREKIERKLGEEFFRKWEYYLAGSEASFKHLGHMVFHLQIAMNPALVPITRDYLYDSSTAMPRSA